MRIRSQVQLAAETPPLAIHASVLQGRGRSRRLAYRIAHWMPGTRVRLVERGRDSTHVIGIASRARGVLGFTPADALGRRRTIDADVLNLDGTPKLPAIVAHYIAPPPIRGGRPGKLRLVRRGTNVILSWSPADGTRRYVVRIKVSDGRLSEFFLPARARRVTISRVLPFETVRAIVLAEGGLNFLPGQTQTVTLRGARFEPAQLPLHPRRLRRLPGQLLS